MEKLPSSSTNAQMRGPADYKRGVNFDRRGEGSGSAHLPSSSTNAQMRGPTDYKRGVNFDRRGEGSGSAHLPSTFSDLLDPFGPTWSLNQVLNLMDQVRDNPLAASARVSPVGRRDWDAREDENAFYLRIDMPGLGKENVRVSDENDTLVIKGEGEKEREDESPSRYNTRIDFSGEYFFMDEIRTEMKNGVLKVVVPKIKEEDLMEPSGDDNFVDYKSWAMLWMTKQHKRESSQLHPPFSYGNVVDPAVDAWYSFEPAVFSS